MSEPSQSAPGRAALSVADPEIASLIAREERREADKLRLIASENYASRAVLEASASCLTNKYSEGYPHKRYYEGQQIIDEVEELAKSRLRALFGKPLADPAQLHVNVQPYSGLAGQPRRLPTRSSSRRRDGDGPRPRRMAATSRTATRSAFHRPKFFNSVHNTGVLRGSTEPHRSTTRCDASRASTSPKLIWSPAPPRTHASLDFAAFRSKSPTRSAAILAADIAHISGLVAAGLHPSPVGVADVVTSTTHKTLRGPRGGMIICQA
jgi:glycine hydroxymethyltransferase